VPRLAEARAYYELEQQLDRRRREMIEIIRKPAHVLPFLQPGRLVKVWSKYSSVILKRAQILVGEKDFGWGCLISYERKTVTVNPADPKDTKHIYVVNVLLNFAPFRGRLTDVNEASPCPVGVKGQPEVVPALLDSVTAISAVRIKYPSDLTPLDARLSVVRVIGKCARLCACAHL
jgi:ATP-dependent RNA helicase DOB1